MGRFVITPRPRNDYIASPLASTKTTYADSNIGPRPRWTQLLLLLRLSKRGPLPSPKCVGRLVRSGLS